MQDIRCDLCKKEFKRKKSQVLLAKKHYCSIRCQNIDKRKGKIIACFVCGRKAYKKNRDLVRSESKVYFCSIKCSNHWLGTNRQGTNHPNWVNGRFVYKKLLQRTGVSQICKLCGEKDKRVLVVHHIDQNRKNNALSNLIWLCQNCHFLIHHHIEEFNRFHKKIKEYGT